MIGGRRARAAERVDRLRLLHEQLLLPEGPCQRLRMLQLHWKNIGTFVVGLAALVMLVALVTGVIMHRKVFKEFFTFRPHKRTQRSALDLHTGT